MSIRRREVYERGVKVSLVDVVRNHPGTVNPLIKSNNLLNNALAMQEALRRGAFEGVMRNYRGELAECTQSNLFIVKNGAALTPPLDAGLLPGHYARVPVRNRCARPASRCAKPVLQRRGSVRRGRGVSYQHHPRARPDRAGRRSKPRIRNTWIDHARPARGVPAGRPRAGRQPDGPLVEPVGNPRSVRVPAPRGSSSTAPTCS